MRAIEKKRPPVITVRRAAALIVAAILVLITAALLYYRSIYKPIWQEQSVVAAEARETAGITQVDQVSKYVWDSPLWIVTGRDEAGEERFVWLNADGQMLLSLKATDSMSKDAVEAEFRASRPDAEILRIQPAYVAQTAAWEVYYKESGKYHYAFYSFTDGSLLENYHLTGKTAS